MANITLTQQSTLRPSDVIVRAVQYFATSRWRPTSQSERAATFEGRRLPLPWFMMLLTIVGYVCCFIPGIVMQICVVKKMRAFQNLVLAAQPSGTGCEVTVTCPDFARKLALGFLASLPQSGQPPRLPPL